MSQLRRIFGDTMIYGLSSALAALVGFVLVPIYTRTFSPSDYGALAQINTTTTLATVLSIFALDNSAAIWFWEHPEPEERSRTFSTWLAFVLGVAALIAAVAVGFRGPLARGLLKDEALSSLWLFFAANILTVNVSRVGNLWFRLHRRALAAVTLNAIPALTIAAGAYLFVVRCRWGLAGALAAQLAGGSLGALVTAVTLRRVLRVSAVDRVRLRPMLRLAGPLVLMTQLSWLTGSAVTYFVNFLCSRTDAGYYQVAVSLTSFMSLVFFAFDQAWTPYALSIRDDAQARRLWGLATEAMAATGIVGSFAIATFASPILLIVASARYLESEHVLAILALNAVALNLPAIFSVTFAVKKVTMPLAKATALGAAVTVPSLFVLTRILGKEGAALAVLTGTLVFVAKAFRDSQRLFAIDIGWRRLGSLAFAAAAGFVLFLVIAQRAGTGRAAGIGIRFAMLAIVCVLAVFIYRTPLRRGVAELRASRESSE